MKKKTVKKYEVSLNKEDEQKKGKGLFNIAIGLLLVAYGFGVIPFSILVTVLGALLSLKGLVQFLK
ncbi:MAG: hypothetical protein ACK4J0_02765 [Candidatus Anstonellaceae archaeon]